MRSRDQYGPIRDHYYSQSRGGGNNSLSHVVFTRAQYLPVLKPNEDGFIIRQCTMGIFAGFLQKGVKFACIGVQSALSALMWSVSEKCQSSSN